MKNPEAPSFASAAVAGVRVDLAHRARILNHLQQALDGTKPFCAVHTLNPEILMQAFRSLDYAKILNEGTLNVVDGVGLQLALRRSSDFEVDRICGADLIFDLATMAQDAGRSMLLLGGQPARLEKAETVLRRRYPKLGLKKLSPTFSPNLPLVEQAQIEELIRSSRPGVVAVFLGAPRQETWIAHNRELLLASDVRIAAGLGGTVDFLSGSVARAPRIIRAAGFEWAFRLLQEPRRLKRQASSLPEFALRALLTRQFVKFASTTEDESA